MFDKNRFYVIFLRELKKKIELLIEVRFWLKYILFFFNLSKNWFNIFKNFFMSKS